MKLAVIDIGSNTVILSVYESSGKNLKEIYYNSVPVGLLNYIEEGALSEKGTRVLADTVADLAGQALRKECYCTFPFATASLRRVSNSREVIEKVRAETGYTIDLIDGQDEAAFSFASVKAVLKSDLPERGIMADLGGGSTEVVSFNKGNAVDSVSLDFGVLSLYRNYVKSILPTPAECNNIRKYTLSRYESLGYADKYGSSLYMVGGSAKAIAKLHAHLSNRPFSLPYELKTDDLDPLLVDLVLGDDKRAKLAAIELEPTRIHTICPGICAIFALAQVMNAPNVIVTSANVREGYAVYAAKLNGLKL